MVYSFIFFEDIAKDYPQIEANSLIVDNTCMQLVIHPEQFDVMVMPNLYGDIVSDLTSGLIGGLGLLPSCNKGDEYAMYEVHMAVLLILLWQTHCQSKRFIIVGLYDVR